MRQIWIPRAGPPEVLEIREAPDPLPGRGQLRVRVEAAGLSFADLLGRLGLDPDLPPLPAVPGLEVAGRIDAIGEDVETDWIGRDVLALTRFGGYGDAVCVSEVQVFVRPAGMSAEQGAAIPVSYLTAFQLIERVGDLRDGDTVLIHGAGGGVGIAAVQLARRIGVTIYATASAAKHDYLTSIGVEHVMDSAREDFEKRVMELTYGRGVDLVLDSIGGRSFGKSARVLSATGRLGLFGASSVAPRARRSRWAELRAGLSMRRPSFSAQALLSANRGVFGVNLGRLWDETARIASWMETLLGYYASSEIAPELAASFPFDRAAEAHRFLHDRKNIGKVILLP